MWSGRPCLNFCSRKKNAGSLAKVRAIPTGNSAQQHSGSRLVLVKFFHGMEKKGGKTTSLPRLEKWYDKTKDERRIVGNPLFGLDAGNGILSRPMFVGTGLVAKNWLVAAKRS